MAIRNIRTLGDSILTKECKPVKEVTEKTLILIEDMLDTMYETNGVGLHSFAKMLSPSTLIFLIAIFYLPCFAHFLNNC